MSAFRPARLGPADVSALVTDPDLAAASGALQAAFTAAVAPKASQASIDALGSTLTPVINTRASQASVDALRAAVDASALKVGQTAEFLATAVPSNFAPVLGSDYVPAGGIIEKHTATSAAGGAVHIASGAGQGVWRIVNGSLQRYTVATNAITGPSYALPAYGTTWGPNVVPAMTAVGSRIYFTGLAYGASGGSSPRAVMFDTNNPSYTEVAALPRAISLNGGTANSRAVTLLDGRVLITSSVAGGLTITPAQTPFWLYDPVTGETPVEVLVALPLTKFTSTSACALMQVLPDGSVLLIDSSAPASGNALSCLLTVVGNTIAVSAASDTLQGSPAVVIPTATGLLAGSLTVQRAYTAGIGWSAATTPAPWAYGTPTGSLNQGQVIPGVGVLLAGITSTAVNLYVWFTGTPYAGALLIKAIRTS